VAGLAGFAGRLSPALEPWGLWMLFLAVSASLGWVVGMARGRPRPPAGTGGAAHAAHPRPRLRTPLTAAQAA
jgi:hypothetical protein